MFLFGKYLFILCLLLFSTDCLALCPGYSWLTELHAKRLSISCKSADKQISDLVLTVTAALHSGRSVEIKNLGEFKPQLSRSSELNKRKLKRIGFKPAKELAGKINNP